MNPTVEIYQTQNATSLKWVFYLTFAFTMLGFISDTPRSLANNEYFAVYLNIAHIVYSFILLPFIITRKISIYKASLLIIYGELFVIIICYLKFIYFGEFTLGLLSVASVLGVLYIGLISLLTSSLHTLIYGIIISTFVLLAALFYPFEADFVFPPVYALILYSFTLGMYIFTNKMIHAFFVNYKNNQKLKQIDAFKNKFFADISHDFRTPLTVINGLAEKIKTQPEIHQQKLRQEAEMIERNGHNLLHLVNQMLDLACIDRMNLKLHFVMADVISYLQYIFECFQSIAETKGIKYYIYKEVDRLEMDFDPDQLYKIVSNLLSNALKYSQEQGEIIFHLQHDTTSQELIIKVSDSGPGIAPEDLPYIFDRFYAASGTKKKEGTGIGLALAKELTEQMNGSIHVESHEKGMVFTVKLPVSHNAERKEKIKTPHPFLPEITPHPEEYETEDTIITDKEDKLVVLLIEDNADVSRFIESCIRDQYHIVKAFNGINGVNKALKLIPDLIITDVMMPEMDGFEVCHTLKNDERTSHIPFIFLTARATDSDKIRGIAGGADAYLVKPFNKTELMVRMEQLIELRRKLRVKYQDYYLNQKQKTDSTEDSFLTKVIDTINREIDNPEFKATDLAFALNLSESQLYRKIKALTGKSTAVYIRSVRLQHAKEKLKHADFNIAETAYACGFNDPAWFSRIFKEEFGYAPSEIKNSN